MHDFKRTNKITGVHWLKEPIENLKICLKLKPQDGIMSLPKFEDYANESTSLNADTFEKVEEYTFKWQEKAFSLWETQRYSEFHNCITENELAYNNILSNRDNEPSKVFTYIHDDYHYPLPSNVTKKKNIFDLNSCFEKLNLSEKIDRVFVEETSSMGRLFRSEENLDIGEDQWVAMHVAFDSSEYNEDFQLVFKQEAVLLSLYHNRTNNYLLVSPDSNQLELNPYTVETEAGVPLGYEYSVSVQFEEGESGEELTFLLNKLHKKWEKKHRHLVNFSMPPLGRKAFHLTLEILAATGFAMDDLYIEFNIKLPEEIQCSDPLKGQTHACKIIRSDEVERWNFGHIAEFNLEIDVAAEPPPLQIFFEAISTDWWGRHRTEGYSYLALSLQPGSTSKQLSCSRPEESDRVEAESRRFFVGGCHLIKDLDVLAKPQFQDTNFIYKTTGNIHIRWHVISQSPLPGYCPLEPTPGTSSASALLMGAEAVLRQYRRARAKLAAATKDLGNKDKERLDSTGDGVEESQA